MKNFTEMEVNGANFGEEYKVKKNASRISQMISRLTKMLAAFHRSVTIPNGEKPHV